MKRSVSTSSQDGVSGSTKRNASAPEAEDSSQVTSSPKTAMPPIFESPAEHEYEQNIVKKNEFANSLKT